MEPSPPWKANDSSAAHEFSNVLWKLKFCHYVQKRLPLVPVLSQINLAYTNPSCFSKIHFKRLIILSSTPFCYQNSVSMLRLSHAFFTPCPSHTSCLDHSNYFWQRVPVTKLLVTQFSPSLYYFISPESKQSP